MKKNEADAAEAAPEPTIAAEEHLSLDEFCIRLSKTDKRVELIGGFRYTEIAAGSVKDSESGFKARFDAFAIKPV